MGVNMNNVPKNRMETMVAGATPKGVELLNIMYLVITLSIMKKHKVSQRFLSAPPCLLSASLCNSPDSFNLLHHP